MISAAIHPSRTNRSPLFEWWRSVDHITLSFLICLLAAGLVLSMGTSPAASARLELSNPFNFLYRHAVFAGLGLSGAIFISIMGPTFARRVGILALLGSVAAMIAVSFIGYEVKGAQRWLRIGSFGLQPSEFAKPAFIVFAAWMFSMKKREPGLPAMWIVLAAYAGLISLLIGQPDFGQSFLLTFSFAAVFFFAGLSLGWMLFFMGTSLVGVGAAYLALPHVKDRVNRFLNPESNDTYQTDKALEAIANGGWLGRGPGEGTVKNSVPDIHTDFIFAATVEEFGFLITLVLIALLAGFVMRAFRNALKLNDYFSQLAVAGLATMIGMQIVINLFVNLNMAPPKGMTLPFISYGGSSMLALCFSAGLILAFTRHRPGAYGYGD
ncbi:MAG: FtsW/RodA/SpoVE family cell cycle protein [Maricaulaceae bacterium]